MVVIGRMKKLVIQIYSFFFKLANIFQRNSFKTKGSLFFLVKIQGKKNNIISFKKALIKRSVITLNGKNNTITIQGNTYNTNILLVGNNNKLKIHENVQVHNTHIIIRGNNCSIEINKDTTFGSSYIVCMGINNFINIGEDCMFADNVEIWNTDSHPIFNSTGNIINVSTPIQIGNHVWCGKNSTILKGVSIGEHSIIGMQTLVTKDIKAHTLNVGIPSRAIKENVNWNRNFITK